MLNVARMMRATATPYAHKQNGSAAQLPRCHSSPSNPLKDAMR
jgi:hypothetical protein